MLEVVGVYNKIYLVSFIIAVLFLLLEFQVILLYTSAGGELALHQGLVAVEVTRLFHADGYKCIK